jgi:outer membrane protein OmpA-like peptidoglycan-associated protein
MKGTKLTVAALSLMMVVGCGTSQGTGTLTGAGAGAALGGLIGGLGNNSHHGRGAAVGALIGGAVGAVVGNRIGHHMDKVKAEVAKNVDNAQVEEVTDANGLKAVKVTFDSGLQFALNKATLRPAAKTDLQKFAQVLKKDNKLSVDVQGYTDATGGDNVNIPLSDKRANAVASYLKSLGVHSSQFKNVAGYGSQNPIVNANVAPQNRRVEVYLYASQAMVNAAKNGTLE